MGRNIETSSYWLMAGVSTTGVSHEKAGVECQDAWACSRSVESDGSVVMAAACVSDGAGSVCKAFTGAKLTAWAVSVWLLEHFPSALEMPRDWIRQSCLSIVRRSIRRAAKRAGYPPDEYAATLVTVCVGSDGAWLALHLGDGGIIGRFGDEILVVSQPEKGEFANESWFTTSSDALEHIRIYGSPFNRGLSSPTGFVLFSDGVEDCLLDRRKGTVAKAASVMLDWFCDHSPDRVSTALQENIETAFRERSHDDCTIVLMAKPHERPEPSKKPPEGSVQIIPVYGWP